ncbi:hypothetical protein [Herbiconiux sp. VKM Ac-2851]|uniref:hypothetical protein n=1 Tax=Herbiconiux sp. VKM Ac-2851 TaxID=2739025 RepID=UPI0015635809|nr:hypothetical protein [Herbiconiux sp. VKM Ac-2851]NQX34053.1 hypothetical protein [Herbiconiux sp. VKM Ac-2851]
MFRIDARSSRELQALILGLNRASKEMQGNIRKYTRSELEPEWQKGLAQRAETRLEHRVLVDTARVSVSNQNVRLKSASLSKSLSGGLKPSESWYAAEFGADAGKTTTYTATSRKGNRYQVTRHTSAQLRPRRRNGYVIGPTVDDLLPRLASLWFQTAIKTLRDGAEGK